MPRELLTSWSDYQAGVDRILSLAKRHLYIYDEDLVQLRLESPERIALLQVLLDAHPADCLTIALRNAAPLRQHSPRLLKLLGTYGHNASVKETPEQLAHLRDTLLIADDTHALVRFDRDQPRAKLLVDDPEEVLAYRQRFAAIWNEGGTPVTATTLGL